MFKITNHYNDGCNFGHPNFLWQTKNTTTNQILSAIISGPPVMLVTPIVSWLGTAGRWWRHCELTLNRVSLSATPKWTQKGLLGGHYLVVLLDVPLPLVCWLLLTSALHPWEDSYTIDCIIFCWLFWIFANWHPRRLDKANRLMLWLPGNDPSPKLFIYHHEPPLNLNLPSLTIILIVDQL